MIKEMIWAVIIKPNYMAELHYGFKNTKKDPKIVYFQLDNTIPLTHADNRAIVNVQLSKVGIVGSKFDIRHFENGNWMMYGTMRYQSEYSKEYGFSYVELIVSTAIMMALSLLALNTIIPFYNDTIQKIEDVKTMQAANPDTVYLVEFK